MCCWATARSQQLLFVVLAAGLWCFTAGCHVKSPLFPQPPLKQKCAPRWEKAEDRRFFTTQRPPRRSTSYKFAAPRYRLPCRLFRWASNLTFQRHERSLSRAVVIKTKSLPVSATTFPTALSLYIAHDGRKHKHNPLSAARRTNLPLLAIYIGCRRWPCRRFRWASNLACQRHWKIAQSCRTVVPKTLPVSATCTTFPTALSFYIAQGRLRKDIRYPSCSQRQNRCHSKRK